MAPDAWGWLKMAPQTNGHAIGKQMINREKKKGDAYYYMTVIIPWPGSLFQVGELHFFK